MPLAEVGERDAYDLKNFGKAISLYGKGDFWEESVLGKVRFGRFFMGGWELGA